MSVISETAILGEQKICFETGILARQAHGAVTVTHRNTVMLATVVSDSGGQSEVLPLTVEYRERLAASGRIPGNFFRRERGLTEAETLTSRLIDRCLRPLLPPELGETVITITVLSADAQTDLEGLAVLAASAALHLSDVPFAGPLGGLNVSQRGEKLKLFNPPAPGAELSLVAACTQDGLVMLEGEAACLTDEQLLAALGEAQVALKPALEAQERLRLAAGRPKRTLLPLPQPALAPSLAEALAQVLEITDGAARLQARQRLLRPLSPEDRVAYDQAERAAVRELTLAGKRLDGRSATALRPVACLPGFLPAPHGSAVFTRGETQAVVTATLGGQKDALDSETLFGMKHDRFMVHYNFNPFAVSEARPSRGPSRRELGHGELARRALTAVLPDSGPFPFTMRVVSDITESNGSSSMATVCGSTLALLNAGVPLQAPVAGVAIGLFSDGARQVILTDIQADEDHHGDMDFKVAGTADALTAFQMDNKQGTVGPKVIAQALAQAQVARRAILAQMATSMIGQEGPRPHAPRQVRLRVSPAKAAELLNANAKALQRIQARTGARMDLSPSGELTVIGRDESAVREVIKAVQPGNAAQLKGQIFSAQVSARTEEGLWVSFEGHEGLIDRTRLVGEPPSVGEYVLVTVEAPDVHGRLKVTEVQGL